VAVIRASIIIRTFNESRHLPALLAAIETQTLDARERETILVDSGSTDGTVAIAESRGCRILTIRREDFSFGRSLNTGCAAARGTALVFVSGHCVPTGPNWLERLIAPIESGEATVSYGCQRGGAETRFSEHQIFQKYFPAPGGQPPTGFFCNNANAAIERHAWERYRFDETLTGLEDLHLAKRVVVAGGTVQYVADAEVLHHHDESWSQVKRRFEREALALRSIMPEIHIGTFSALRYFLLATSGDWKRAWSTGALIANAWAIVAYRFCQYYGSWLGNHTHRQLSRQARERYFYPHDVTQTGRTSPDEGPQRASAGQELPNVRGQAAGPLDSRYPAGTP
jgi:glycosyltransferase involved in cell wall biosynthesis